MRIEVAVLVGIVLAVLVVLVALFRRPPAVDKESGRMTLRYRAIVPAAGVLALLAALGVAALLVFARTQQHLNKGTYQTAYLMIGGFLLLGAPLLVVWFGARLVVGDEGITRYSLLGKPVQMRWDEIVEYDSSGRTGYYVLKGRDGRKLRINVYYDGLGKLDAVIRQRAPGLSSGTPGG